MKPKKKSNNDPTYGEKAKPYQEIQSGEKKDSRSKELDGLVAQWSQLCGYLEKLDTEHWNVFTIILAALGLLLVINTGVVDMEAVYWAMPVVIMFVFYHEAYRLREVAVLKGYLARIEDRIHEIYIGMTSSEAHSKQQERVFRWFAQTDIAYMSRNNIANNFFPIPILVTAAVSHLYFVYKKVFGDHNYFYLLLIILIVAFELVPIASVINNGKIQTRVREGEIDSMANGIRNGMRKRHLYRRKCPCGCHADIGGAGCRTCRSSGPLGLSNRESDNRRFDGKSVLS